MTRQIEETTAPANLPIRKWDWRETLQRVGPLLALILLVTFTAWRSDRFLSPENILNILRQNSPVGILAVGMTFVIILGGIDLSVGSLLALAGGMGIWTMNTAVNAAAIIQRSTEDATAFNADSAVRVWLAKAFTFCTIAGSPGWAIGVGVTAVLLVGIVGGLINGLLISRGRLTPFIATLGTMAAFRSLAVSMVDAGEFRSAVSKFRVIGGGGIQLPIKTEAGQTLEVGYPVITFLSLVLILWLVLRRTRYGRYVTAIGSNERAAIYSAINVKRIKLQTYCLMGLLTAVAALLQAARLNSVSSSSTGMLNELDAIAAVAIGGTSMRGGSGTVLGSLVGVLLLGVIGNMLTMLNINPYLQGLVKGAIVIGAVLIQRGRSTE